MPESPEALAHALRARLCRNSIARNARADSIRRLIDTRTAEVRQSTEGASPHTPSGPRPRASCGPARYRGVVIKRGGR